jgi:histidine phosphotransferase ChpT
MGKNKVKLLLNLCLIADMAIPRGGALTISGEGEGEEISFRVEAKGPNARLAPEVVRLLSGESDEATLDARAIQAYYAGLVAEACELEVAASGGGDAIVIEAKPKVLPAAEELSAPESAVA